MPLPSEKAPAEFWRVESRVTGLVQGVGYRWYVLDAAAALGAGGYVRNLPGGGVEMTATGPRIVLESLLDRFRKGPHEARVDRVEVSWTPLAEPPAETPFEVRP